MPARGYYVVVEGIDGSGTTTHARLLVEKLERLGYCARFVEEPSKDVVGGLIRHMLRHGPFRQHIMTLLFAADRLLLHENLVRSLLKRGCIVVSDRSWVSSLVYQSCDCFSDSVPLDWIYTVNRYAAKPDVLVYIDVEPVIAYRRLVARGRVMEQPEKLSILRSLHRRYREVLNMLKGVVPAVVWVEASPNGVERSIERVSAEVTVKVLAAINYLEAVTL